MLDSVTYSFFKLFFTACFLYIAVFACFYVIGKIFLTNTINHFMPIHNQHHFLMGYFDKIYKIIIP